MTKQKVDPEELDKHLHEYSSTVFDILDKVKDLLSYYWLWDDNVEVSFIRSQDKDDEVEYRFRIKLLGEIYLTGLEIKNLIIMARKMHMKLLSTGVDKNDNRFYIEFGRKK